MQDRDVVAAIVAGEPEGIAEAYDRYAGSLYAYCHWLLSRPEAAEAVRDTFLIAVLRLDGLGDPDRLDAWLHAVARNECLRRLGPKGPNDRKGPKDPKEPEGPQEPAGAATAAVPVSRSADPDELPAVTLPPELRGQVLTACADNSPAGRAHRVSVTHRAGTFGPSGFPKAIGPAGPRWWQRVRSHPRPVAVVAVMAAVAATAVIMTVAGSHHSQASALGFGAGVAGGSSSPIPTPRAPAPGRVSAAPSPTHKAAPSASPTTPPVTMPAGAPSPLPPSVPVTQEPSASPSQTSSSASPSPSPSSSPAQGSLLAAPDKLQLTAAKGKAASGFFVLTATGGPISEYTIKVPAAVAGKVTVSPSKGSLPANGYAVVPVTVTSNVALDTYVTVEPGNLTISVVLEIKA
jgi:DNA-directed RNA polymerase specialized sigma24 family protein